MLTFVLALGCRKCGAICRWIDEAPKWRTDTDAITRNRVATEFYNQIIRLTFEQRCKDYPRESWPPGISTAGRPRDLVLTLIATKYTTCPACKARVYDDQQVSPAALAAVTGAPI